MNTMVKLVSTAGLGDHIFTGRQLADILGGSDARRYGLVNRALKDGSLIRIKRSLYMLSPDLTNSKVHPFAIAQALLPLSYVSFETALSFHQWIPEGVFATASVTTGRKSMEQVHERLGCFTFHPLALQNYQFLNGVTRVQSGKHTALVANPLRALMDLVAHRKKRWSGLDWIVHGLRVDDTYLVALKRKDFTALTGVYKHKTAQEFLASMEDATFDRKSKSRVIKTRHDWGAT